MDDDLLGYFVKVYQKLPVFVVKSTQKGEGEQARTCSYDRAQTYERPEHEWAVLSNDPSRNFKAATCVKSLRQQWGTASIPTSNTSLQQDS